MANHGQTFNDITFQAITASTEYWLALQISGNTSLFYYDETGGVTDKMTPA